MKTMVTEIKNTLGKINSRLGDTEEFISDLEGRITIITVKRKQILKNEKSLKDFWTSKHTKIHIIGVPEGEKGMENIYLEILAEKFANLSKETDIQVQEAHKVPNKISPQDPHQDTT